MPRFSRGFNSRYPLTYLIAKKEWTMTNQMDFELPLIIIGKLVIDTSRDN